MKACSVEFGGIDFTDTNGSIEDGRYQSAGNIINIYLNLILHIKAEADACLILGRIAYGFNAWPALSNADTVKGGLRRMILITAVISMTSCSIAAMGFRIAAVIIIASMTSFILPAVFGFEAAIIDYCMGPLHACTMAELNIPVSGT